MKKVLFGFIVLTYGFNSSADIRDSKLESWLKHEALVAYADKYPRECFQITYPISTESRPVFSDIERHLSFDDRFAATTPPIWHRTRDEDSRVVFWNNEQRCIESRESFQSDFEFSDELIEHIGADRSNLNPRHLRFLRNVKMYETVSGNDYMYRYYNVITN